MHHYLLHECIEENWKMEKQRQKISRRDFLRIAGLSSTSAAALTLTPKALHAIKPTPTSTTEIGSSADRPWWVRVVDEPTTEIDWDQIQRFDARNTARGAGFAKYVGEDRVISLSQIAKNNEKERILNDVPGYGLKDQALFSANQISEQNKRSFLGPQHAPTPADRNVPKWTGTPQEAAQMLRTALRHFGAATVGFVELNEQTQKLIYSHDPDGKQISFDDVDEASETAVTRTIPNKAKWIIVYTVRMSIETMKRAPTRIAAQTTSLAYQRGAQIQNNTQEFLRGLGYQGLGEAFINALGISPALAVMAGLGEMSRLNRLITPEFGPMVRVFKLITDLPLAPDKPIDAGIMEFCINCKKCAEACPPGALSFEDNPTWEIKGGWSNPGHKAYFEDSIKCRTYWYEEAGSNCGICFSVCPFSKKDKAWLHRSAKAAVSTLPEFGDFLRSMDDAFSYAAQKDSAAWWQLDLPEYGLDTGSAPKEAS